MNAIEDFIIEGTTLKKYTGSNPEVYIPDGLTEIGDCAFQSRGNNKSFIKKVYMPDSITKIGVSVFDGCDSIEEITLSKNLVEIGRYAFCDCKKLSEIYIPESVRYIQYAAFCGCNNLTNIIIDDKNNFFEFEDNVLFYVSVAYTGFYGTVLEERYKSSIIFCSPKKSGKYVAPSTIERIYVRAFSGCDKLSSITLSNRIKTIDPEAFADCKLLKEIIIPGKINEIKPNAFKGCEQLRIKGEPRSMTYLYSKTNGIPFEEI